VAVDRHITVSAILRAPHQPPFLERAGTLSALDVPLDADRLMKGFRAACDYKKKIAPPVHIRASSVIPVARGLGSSAAATIAGIAAADALLRLGLTDLELARIGAAVEGHPDNVAPSVFGGAVLSLMTEEGSEPAPGGHMRASGLSVAELRVSPELCLVFAVPEFTLDTARARAALPATVPHAVAARAAALSAALVHGLAEADAERLSLGLGDVLHVPHRRGLVRGYDSVTAAARAAGAHGATLSGSGPTIVAVSPRTHREAIGSAMCSAWAELGVQAECFHSEGRIDGYSVSVRTECEPESELAETG
jgi:homoserine kinase